MKQIRIISAFLMATVLVSCELGNDETSFDVDYDTEATAEAAFEDIDNVVESGMDVAIASAGRVERDLLLACAEVNHDSTSRTITIIYPESGCEGPRGRIRKGTITINYSGRRFQPGATRVVTLTDFYLDDNKIEGTRTVTNVSASRADFPTFEVTLTDGRITFEDGTFATRNASHTRTWYRTASPATDSATFEGQASGENRDGLSYSMFTTEPLMFKRSCSRVFVPVSGVKVFTVDGNETIIDFGNGACDETVTINRNGETREREIDGRRRRRG